MFDDLSQVATTLQGEADALRRLSKTLVAMPVGCRLVASRLDQVREIILVIAQKTPCAGASNGRSFLKEEKTHEPEENRL